MIEALHSAGWLVALALTLIIASMLLDRGGDQ